MLEVDWRGDVDRAGGDVHLGGNSDWVAGVAAVHRRGDGGGVGAGRHRGRVVNVVTIFITGVIEASLPVCLQVTGDVCGTEHLAAYVAGDLALVPDHVGAQAVFGGKGGGAGRYLAFERSL